MKKTLSLLALAISASSLSATTISIDSWSLTTTEVTLTISGSISAAEGAALAPTSSLSSIFIGVPGDTDWITGNSDITLIDDMTAQPLFPAMNVDGITLLTAGTTSGEPSIAGDSILIIANNPFSSTDAPDFSDGGSINLTLTIPGTFTPANVDPSQLLVGWGAIDQSLPFPNAGTIIGDSAVPEPSTAALLLGVAAIGFATLRRRK